MSLKNFIKKIFEWFAYFEIQIILFFILIRSAVSIHIQSDNDAHDNEELILKFEWSLR